MQGERSQKPVVLDEAAQKLLDETMVELPKARFTQAIQMVSGYGKQIKELQEKEKQQEAKIQELEKKCAGYDANFQSVLEVLEKSNANAKELNQSIAPLKGLIFAMNMAQQSLKFLAQAYKELDSVIMSFSRIVLTSTAIGAGLSVLCSQRPTVNFVFNRLPLTLVDRVFLSHMPNMLYINSDVARLGLSMGHVIGFVHCGYNILSALAEMIMKLAMQPTQTNGQNYLDYAANTVSVLSLAYTGYQMRQGAIGFADVKVQAVVCAISALMCFRKYMNQQEKIDWTLPKDDSRLVQ
jgi:hypothetical protein